MLFRSISALISSVFIATTAVSETAPDASAGTNTTVQPVSTTHAIGSDGAFTYSVPFKVPSFKGLVPNLGLAYNSQNQSRRGAEDFVALGWRLAGLSSIDRVSVGGGAPTYSLKNDVFRLDGIELLACNKTNSAVTNPWSMDYPAAYRTSTRSASCEAGGNMTTLRDNYLKIVRSGSDISKDTKFYVYKQNGTRLTYESVGKLAGANPNIRDDHFQAAYRRKWVLTEIRDKQKRPNIVKINYYIADQWSGFAPRPKSVEYAGYKTTFHYKSNPQPVGGFATGTKYIAKQNYRLNAVTVTDGSTKIRAYRLVFAQSSQTKGSLLTQVIEYANNYTLSSAAITNGSKLPAWKFTYQGDSTYFGWKDKNIGNFHTNLIVSDVNDDGRDELVFGKYTQKYNGNTRFTQPQRRQFFLNDGKKGAYLGTRQVPDAYGNYSTSSSGSSFKSILGVTRRDSTTGHQYVIMWNKSGSGLNTQSLSSYRLGDTNQTVISTVSVNSRCRETTERVRAFVGNFDTDKESEVVFGDRYYDVNDGKLQRVSSREQDLPTLVCDGEKFPDNGLAAADIDGDGQDELIGRGSILDIREGKFKRVTMTLAESPFGDESAKRKWIVRFGDVNGDGAADAVIHDRRSGTDRIGVSLSTGKGFKNPDWTWDNSISMPNFKDSNYGSPRTMVRDINGDGIADVIVHNGYSSDSLSATATIGLRSLTGYIYLSDGKRFFKQSGAYNFVPEFLTLADVDGDGLLDTVSGNYNNDLKDTVLVNGSQVPNLMRTIIDRLGGTTEIKYTPSSRFSGNDIPAVQQLVTEVTRKSGFSGQNKVTTYSYSGNKFDYKYRKSLGFRTVTAELPKGTGETEKPKLVTVYKNDHWGTKGLIQSQTLSYKGKVQRQVLNDWSVTSASSRPLRAQKTKTRNKEIYGGSLIEKTVEFTYNLHNQLTLMIDRGFGGTNAGADDVTTAFNYKLNKSAYIVDKPEWKIIAKGATASYNDRRNWLRAEYYTYDSLPNFYTAPTRGNLYRIEQWTGGTSHGRRTQMRMWYDDWGNVSSVRNALNRATTFKYDTSKHLFLTETTSVLGHVSRGTWNASCQSQLTEVDANGSTTRFYYDGYCRETRVDYPSGQRQWTSYHGLGNPTAQYVRKRAYSGSTNSNMDLTETREYFNGYGQTYVSGRSGSTEALSDMIITKRAYDGRGKLYWESIPKPWSTFSGTFVQPTERTTYLYDPLGRLVRKTNPDASYATIEYARDRFRSLPLQTTHYPTIVTRDEHCYDAASANTICGIERNSQDAQGMTIRTYRYDNAKTDYGAGSSTARITQYAYDNIGQLKRVIDPIGANWYYSYDVYGNQIEANDPALGIWKMTYDAAGNLKRQTDAKNNTIDFWYDAADRITLKRVGPNASRVDTRYYYDEARSGYFNLGSQTTAKVWNPTDGYYHTVERNYDRAARVSKETHLIDGKRYDQYVNYRKNGAVNAMRLPYAPGQTSIKWLPQFQYDAAGRMISFGSHITSATYNIWNNPTKLVYGNGTSADYSYHSTRGWLNRMNVRRPSGSQIDYIQYYRTAKGRVYSQKTQLSENRLNYTYDYAGRLKTVTNFGNRTAYNQTFTYDKGGNMRSNSHLGDYYYRSRTHAPHRVIANGVQNDLTYDANGNMTKGLGGKIIAYDNENRPISVTNAGKVTRYVYGADGARLKVIEGSGTANETVTAFFGHIEIKNFGQGSAEKIISHPHQDVRFVNGVADYMHSDQQNTVRMHTNAAGERAKRAAYTPFGDAQEFVYDASLVEEDKGYIGQVYDDDSNLQYLNARYYDPVLGLFTQPDWFDVRAAGVGTNRYAYAFGDPVNMSDPGGNFAVTDGNGNVIGYGSDDLTPIGPGQSVEDAWQGGEDGSSNTVSFNETFGEDTVVTFNGSVTVSPNYSGTIHAYYFTPNGNNVVVTQNSPITRSVYRPSGQLLSSNVISVQGLQYDLAMHELYGGHAISRHVGKTDAFLRSVVRPTLMTPLGIGVARRTHGTFTTLASANRLVNSTLASRPDLVAQVASGARRDAIINLGFGSVTGRESYRTSRSYNSAVTIRPTYGVRVAIRNNSNVPGNVHIVTAFPTNNYQ